MIASEIMLPPHAPEIYLDRATLWNAVENCEKHPKAQLAYSFDIAMQNELTLEENMELARKFVQEQLDVYKRQMYVEVKVTDTGKGISESNQAAIFRRFYREEEVHEQQGVGVGPVSYTHLSHP